MPVAPKIPDPFSLVFKENWLGAGAAGAAVGGAVGVTAGAVGGAASVGVGGAIGAGGGVI